MKGPDMKKLGAEPVMEKIVLDQAYLRAKKILEVDAIKPEAFVGHYDEAKLARDRKYVSDREAEFSKRDTPESAESKKIATIIEAMFHDQIELSEWLGPSVVTIRPTLYDDIKNSIDIILEFRREKERTFHLGLAIDVTFGSEIDDKLDSIKKEIDRGKLPRIAYFLSKNEDDVIEFIGELPNIPRVVIGADMKTLMPLIDLWMAGDKKALAEHPIQFQILEQIHMQLEAFGRYARDPRIAAVYRRTRLIVEEIMQDKEELRTRRNIQTADLEKDRVFVAIKAYLDEELPNTYKR